MALFNRIKVTTATTGTGSITLGSTGVRDATNGDCLAPAEISSLVGNQTVSYFITSGNNFAYGYGNISSNGLTLTRDPREISWNGTTFAAGLLTLAGTSIVYISPNEEDISAGSVGVSYAISRGFYQVG